MWTIRRWMCSFILVLTIFVIAFQFIQDSIIYQRLETESTQTPCRSEASLAFDQERFGGEHCHRSAKDPSHTGATPLQRRGFFEKNQISNGDGRGGLSLEILQMQQAQQEDYEYLSTVSLTLVDRHQTRGGATAEVEGSTTNTVVRLVQMGRSVLAQAVELGQSWWQQICKSQKTGAKKMQ